MFTIKNNDDLKLAYLIMSAYETGEKPEKVIECKREIRRFLNRPGKNERIVKDYGIDGYIILFPLPSFVKSMNEAENYFEENCVIYARPSIYDCTGQAFTNWYKIVFRNNQFFVYHSVGFDV